MISNSEISFCVDTMLVEAYLAEPKLYKKAGVISDFMDRVKEYFSAHIDQKNPVSSVFNILAPGAISLLFSAIGLGKFGLLLGFLMEVFHVNVYGLFGSIAGKIRSMISGGEKVSSSQIDSAVNESVQESSTPVSMDDARKGYQVLQEKTNKTAPEGSWADDNKVYSSLELLGDAKMFKLALIDYEHQKMRLTKEAGFGSFLAGFGSTRAKGTSLIAKIFGWIIKIALVSAGLMVAGDVANKVVGRPNALDHTYQAGTEPKEVAVAPTLTATQTKFPFKGDAPLQGTWPLTNSPANISNMLVQFAKDVYNGLDGKESIIQSSPAFQDVKEQIEWFNVHNPGTAVIFIPKEFTTKKHIVDHFIDDVARMAP